MRTTSVLAGLIVGLFGLCFHAQSADAFLGYSVVPAFPNLPFNSPVCIASPPGETNRLFVLEKTGAIVVITNLAAPNRTVFMSVASHLDVRGECGLLGITFHPNFSSNGYFYLFYTPLTPNGNRYDRVSRFSTDPTDPNAGLIASEQILISQPDLASNHQGADIHFGPDGYLYIPVGDEGGANDAFGNSQRIAHDFFSGILRIDVDKRPGNLEPNPHAAITTNYLVPADNPFVGATSFNGRAVDPTKVRTEFWAVGLRNPWRITFDEQTGDLYCGDVGQDSREEVDIIVKGGNYGWNYREGTIARPGSSAAPAGFSGTNPILDYSHGTGTNRGDCVIGGSVYHGQKLSQLAGAYVFADYISGNIWALTYTGTLPVKRSVLAIESGIVAFGKDPRDGEILMASITGKSIRKLILTPDHAPTVHLLSPMTPRVTNSPVTFGGTAADDSLVTQVVFQVNGADFQPANGTTNWTFSADMVGGTNDVVIKAFDDAGHESTSLTVTRYCVINSQLTVDLNGSGTTTPNLNGKLLEVGKTYQTKAVPGPGFVFENWSGGVASTNPVLNFVMQSNLILNANFIANPFPALHGIYSGLFLPSTSVASDNAGFINLTLATAGTYVGTIQIDGISYKLSGRFSAAGTSSIFVTRLGKSTLNVTLQLNLAAPDGTINGTVSDGNWSATVLAHRQVYAAPTNPATKWAGHYTFLLPPDAEGPVDLRGFGYGTCSITLNGKLQLAGGLADGVGINQTVAVSPDGSCPIYVPLYPGTTRLTNNSIVTIKPENKGFLIGWLSVSNAPDSIMTGNLNWVKKPWTNQFWPNGFTNNVSAIGSVFVAPAHGTRIINITNFTATSSGSVLTSNILVSLQLGTNNLVSSNGANPSMLTLQFNLTNGLVSGRFVDSATGTNTIKAAILQRQNYGAGLFIGTNKPGAFLLQAQ